ncbi:MAG TPA: ABC transporter substrate-binding protein [Acidimicrobiales bacterium]
MSRNGQRRTARLPALGLLVAGALTIGVVVAAPAPAQSTNPPTVLHIGALLSITGAGSSLGNTSRAALEVATARWNQTLTKQHQDMRVELDVVDTGQDPTSAVAGFQQLAAQGVRIIIGPQSSSEVAAIQPLANAQGVLVVSQGSTASSLAMPNDNIFRFVPNDHVEGRATTDLLVRQGIHVLVPIWRDDRGNQGLADSVRSAATSANIQVSAGFRYESDTTSFAPALQAVAAQVAAATQQAGAGHVGVYLAGFEETADVLAAAQSMTGLSGARWYGGDGSAQATQLVDSTNAASFAVAVHGYPSPLVALPATSTPSDASLIQQIRSRAHAAPDAFGLAAYDAFNVAVRTLRSTGTSVDGPALRAAFARTANGYKGVTGTIRLDPSGDRTSAPYAYWSICSTGRRRPQWVQSGTWTPNPTDPTRPGRVTGGSCPS